MLLAVDAAILVILATPWLPCRRDWSSSPWGRLCFSSEISAVFGFLIIKPRDVPGRPGHEDVLYSHPVRTREQYKQAFSSTPDEMLNDYLDNIYTLAMIQRKKFFYLQESLYCLILGLVPIMVMTVAVH